MKVVVQEFHKLHKPKINKLKGGYSATANLIFQSWLKDINVHVEDWNLTEREAIQLVKLHKVITRERMSQRMLMWMTFRFLVRKIIAHKPSFRAEANEQLKNQYVHKLHNQYYAAIAHSVLQTSNPSETLTQFLGQLELTFGSHSKLGKVSSQTVAIETTASMISEVS